MEFSTVTPRRIYIPKDFYILYIRGFFFHIFFLTEVERPVVKPFWVSKKSVVVPRPTIAKSFLVLLQRSTVSPPAFTFLSKFNKRI